MTAEIIWRYTHTRFYHVWRSDCCQYSISVSKRFSDIAILNDFSIENKPAYTEQCSSFKEAKKLANGWKQEVMR